MLKKLLKCIHSNLGITEVRPAAPIFIHAIFGLSSDLAEGT